MAPFIAMMITRARETSLDAGQARYRAYFVKTAIYVQFKADVEAILYAEGKEDCIVTV